MGQKGKAIGLRLGGQRSWDATWCTQGAYSDYLHQDLATQVFLKRFFESKGFLVGTPALERALGQTQITLPLLSLGGADPSALLQEETLSRTLTQINGPQVHLHLRDLLDSIQKVFPPLLQRVVGPALSAYRARPYFEEGLRVLTGALLFRSPSLLAQYIGRQLEKDYRHNAFLDYLKKALPLMVHYLPEVRGLRIQVKGRLNGADRSKTQWFQEGALPFQSLGVEVDYGQASAFTPYGVCGVKVWICFHPSPSQSTLPHASASSSEV